VAGGDVGWQGRPEGEPTAQGSSRLLTRRGVARLPATAPLSPSRRSATAAVGEVDDTTEAGAPGRLSPDLAREPRAGRSVL